EFSLPAADVLDRGHDRYQGPVHIMPTMASFPHAAATTSGMIDPAGPRKLKRTSGSSEVAVGLTCTTAAPRRAACSGTAAAGYTSDDVPTLNSTSHDCAASNARDNASSGNASPNQTTPGRTGPPQWTQRGGSSRRPA